MLNEINWPGNVTEAGTHHTSSTYVTQVHCVHSCSGEIRVVWDWGVPMQGVCISQPVQALRVRQTDGQGRAEIQLYLVKAQEKSSQCPLLALPFTR